ncbi:Gti1/Pac2 family-domain-containing protein [Pisolithus orientalis]|uniref:Gti1/Pac2 family-domain-containing protein n=1 Tax=Pisolithus orientalis TaxID=936130 RepID=UPI002225521C|nr:Gti1/Pac2 family-domain-containing protein [Pisolithus orientalis]KAI6001637.1 Gti1/Pac2 family-domain-containing protein [Pisolithus orientalis]
MQQKPTCTNVRIRSTRDAHKIFYAVQLRILPMITRRLDGDERLALCSGCIYAWEERGPHTEITGLGIERFTEGKRWSPSRVRDEFLFYYEKYTPPTEAGGSGASDKQPPRDWDPLVKQTYSVWVETEKGRRKWHLTAYFTQATVDQLGTIDDIPGVAELVVPEGTFQSTRVSKSRKGDDSRARSDLLKPTSSSVTRTYAPFPSAYPIQANSFSTPTFVQEPGRLNSYASHTSCQSSEAPQYSVPTPLSPVTSSSPTFSTTRSDDDADYKCRRPSLPTNSPPASDNRRTSMDYSMRVDSSTLVAREKGIAPVTTSDYRRRDEQYHLPPTARCDMGLPSARDSGAAFSRNTSPYSYNLRSSRSPQGSSSSDYGTPVLGYTTVSGPRDAVSSGNSSYPYSPYTAPSYTTRGTSQISLPPPAQLLSPERPSQLYEVTSSLQEKPTGIGSRRVDLAPLHSLKRSHPYKRDPVDDKTLRLLVQGDHFL